MAGDWIKMNKSLLRDPRVVRISSALKADRLRTIGGLLSAWCLADEQTEDGRLDAYTPELLDELVGLPGLSRAMESVGWLVIHEEFIEFPRFSEHNGQSAKRRAQDAARKMSARKADKCPHDKRTKDGPEKRREDTLSLKTKSRCELDSAKAFALEIGLAESDGEYCFHKWTGNGWKNGNAPIKCWKSTMRSWKTAGYMPSQKVTAQKQSPTKGIRENLQLPML